MEGHSWEAAINNSARIQAALDSLTTNGSVQIPAGRYLIAQTNVNEALSGGAHTGVFVASSNVELIGAGKTNTILVAHNRATTLFYLGRDSAGNSAASTNITFHDISFEGRPHVMSSGTNGITWWEEGALISSSSAGSLLFSFGDLAGTNYNRNILFTNCTFRNPAIMAVYFWGLNTDFAIRNCDFIGWDGMNGAYSRSSAHRTCGW